MSAEEDAGDGVACGPDGGTDAVPERSASSCCVRSRAVRAMRRFWATMPREERTESSGMFGSFTSTSGLTVWKKSAQVLASTVGGRSRCDDSEETGSGADVRVELRQWMWGRVYKWHGQPAREAGRPCRRRRK